MRSLLALLLATLLTASASAQTPDLTLETAAPPVSEPSGRFGYSVSGVPDANGDGLGDLLVGAYNEDGGGVGGSGRAYLVSGTDGTLLQTLESPNPEVFGSFGFSVAGVPDANGDGRGDLLVGAYQEDGGGVSEAGRAYLFSGADGTLLQTLASPNPEVDGKFGYSVSGVPDANGDGLGDLLVGAYGEDVGGVSNAGRAYLFSGADGTLLQTLESPNPETSGFFGGSVAGVPDANGDGRGDLLIGANLEDGGGVNASGRAYLVSGATGTLLQTLESPNLEVAGRFGGSVSGVPDANGDGLGDLLVGAYNEDGGGVSNAGRAYLVSGTDGTLLQTLESPNPEVSGVFGLSVAGVPDVNGDGRGDLLVGANQEDVGGVNDAGRAYLLSGVDGTLLQTLESPNPEVFGSFGLSVAGVPDANGDGLGDLLVGAYGEDVGGVNFAGRAYLVSGTDGTLLQTLDSSRPETFGSFGYSVAGVPDANGDGRGDLLVGADAEDGGGVDDAGRAYLVSGADGTLLQTLESPNPEVFGSFGLSVAGVPDANGDGRGDLLVGAYREDGGGVSDAGRAYLVSGADGTLLRTLASPNPEVAGYFGYSVAGVPDANGDGRGDLLVGAYNEDGGGTAGSGRAYLFSGTDGALLQTFESPNPAVAGNFGSSVAGVPDANGDGRGDLLVGAYREDGGGGFGSGRAYLFSGADGALLRTLTSPNPEFSGIFGTSVSGVPDANGDGRGDLLIGAYNEDGGGVDAAGRAYLVSGADGTLLQTLASPNPEATGNFGYSVSGVPDANSDGRGDLLVGAYREDGGGVDASGRAYLVSGADGTLLRTLESPNPEVAGSFGLSVSGVPDANSDGRGDLLVGAYNEDGGGVFASGRAYRFSLGITPSTPLAGPQGWRLLAAPAEAPLFTALLDPIWTQGALGASSSDGDPVVYAYDETLAGGRDAGFTAVPDLRVPTTIGQGYAVYVFEDDDPFTPGTQGGFPKTLSATGLTRDELDTPLPVSFTDSGSLGDDGWNLVGNPFDVWMDWDATGWTRTGLDNVIYVWDPTSGTYKTWNGTAGSLGDGLVPTYTGFWVKAFESGASLVAPAGARTETPPPPAPLGPSLALRLNGTASGVAVQDAAFVSFVEGASPALDPFDAYELAPLASTYASLFARSAEGPLLDIDARASLAGTETFDLDALAVAGGTSVGGAFMLSWPDLSTVPDGWALTLTDTETGQTVDLRSQASYAFTLAPSSGVTAPPVVPGGPPVPRLLAASTAQSAASRSSRLGTEAEGAAKSGGSSRFVLTVGAVSTAGESGPAYRFGIESTRPNPTRGTATITYALEREGPVRLAVYDALGREVALLASGPAAPGRYAATLDAAALSSGVYIVRLSTATASATRRLTVIR